MTLTYTEDAYKTYSASALAGIGLIRNLVVRQQVRAQSLIKETLAELTEVFSTSGQGAEVAEFEMA